jgi:NTE family protein
VYVDTGMVGAIDFRLSREQRDQLIAAGREAGEQFLARWDYAEWLAECRTSGDVIGDPR